MPSRSFAVSSKTILAVLFDFSGLDCSILILKSGNEEMACVNASHCSSSTAISSIPVKKPDK